MASNPLTSECRRFPLENAHVGASREDSAFSVNHQGSERGLLGRSHGASQVFNELLAEQVQRRIRQGEYPESARGLEAHLFIHHCLHSGTMAIGIISLVRPQSLGITHVRRLKMG